jgi:hypothetical protein
MLVERSGRQLFWPGATALARRGSPLEFGARRCWRPRGRRRACGVNRQKLNRPLRAMRVRRGRSAVGVDEWVPVGTVGHGPLSGGRLQPDLDRGSTAVWTAGDEDALATVRRERLPGETAVECFQAESGDVEQTEPLVLRGPPQMASRVVVTHEIDSVVAYGVAQGVWCGFRPVDRSLRAATRWSKAKAFQANRPPRRSEAATRSKTRRRSAQVGRCSSARNGR